MGLTSSIGFKALTFALYGSTNQLVASVGIEHVQADDEDKMPSEHLQKLLRIGCTNASLENRLHSLLIPQRKDELS